CWLADPAERQGRDGNAELVRREVGCQVLRDFQRQTRAGVASSNELLEARRPHFDDRELGGDEEAVRENEQEGYEKVKECRHVGPMRGLAHGPHPAIHPRNTRRPVHSARTFSTLCSAQPSLSALSCQLSCLMLAACHERRRSDS